MLYYDSKIYLSDGNGRLKRNEDGDLLVFRYISIFRDGLAIVELVNGKWNFIDTEGNYLSKQWFDATGSFREGFACVCLKGKYNYIDRDCNYIGKQWFNEVGYFKNGFARVGLKGKFNFIDRNGNYLSKQWFDGAGDFGRGVAWVELNYMRYTIDKDGNLHNGAADI